jgi:hypothetical protein
MKPSMTTKEAAKEIDISHENLQQRQYRIKIDYGIDLGDIKGVGQISHREYNQYEVCALKLSPQKLWFFLWSFKSNDFDTIQCHDKTSKKLFGDFVLAGLVAEVEKATYVLTEAGRYIIGLLPK